MTEVVNVTVSRDEPQGRPYRAIAQAMAGEIGTGMDPRIACAVAANAMGLIIAKCAKPEFIDKIAADYGVAIAHAARLVLSGEAIVTAKH